MQIFLSLRRNFIDALVPFRLTIMKQNEEKWRRITQNETKWAKMSKSETKFEHGTLGNLGKTGRILTIFRENKQFLSNFGYFRKTHEYLQNAFQMGGYEAKNDVQNLRPPP